MAGSNKRPVPLTDLSVCANSRGRRAYCYAELAVSSPAVGETLPALIASTCRRMARLSGPGKYRDGRPGRGAHQSQY